MAKSRNYGRVVLFGGQLPGASQTGDTWEWDGVSWSLQDAGDPDGVTAPMRRQDHAMTFDRHRMVTILFGADSGGTQLDDTWEWNGSTWIKRSPTTAPEARSDHAMAYDSDRCETVLFGGYNGTDVLGDTWLYGPGGCPTVPVTSEWGLVVMTLLLITAGTLLLFRRGAAATAQ